MTNQKAEKETNAAKSVRGLRSGSHSGAVGSHPIRTIRIHTNHKRRMPVMNPTLFLRIARHAGSPNQKANIRLLALITGGLATTKARRDLKPWWKLVLKRTS